ncbi:MAG TPA: P-loop NTPase fold protein, partial [Solirubrobacteraceae bacterium]|nr:P-loop NTPase fold protein [Solirubrobacteraceae bacterium]
DGELVDDRSLQAFDADSFGHGDFVRELTGMVCQTRTPANIALFGAWGSGKSSIANLLREELPDDKSKVRFVDFDASKYAEAPLRRHFISQVAHGLGISSDRYHRGLYTGEESRDVKFRAGEWKKLTLAFLGAVALTFVVLLAIATGVAGLSAGPFESSWSSIIKDYLLATLPVAAVITAFVKLAADGFHIKTTRNAPSGEEEFERLFKSLVSDSKTKRLVVFIDELDRCSPQQVASTLETLKTFLFVERCVFVVAADQQVLEQALRRKARQHTPEDTSNPYYSAGSSYLDKVFQYQLTLPPLRSPALSRFALTLVEGSPGVWQRVPALDEAMSVLIPTHVVSPRRVKVLLNRFAIAYRIAERRAARGQLDPDVGARASELAKLVCLQSEFPLFADDLTLDARLPELVRMAADGEQLPSNLPREVAQRATEYARGRRVVAELLVDADQDSEDELETVPAHGTATADDDRVRLAEDDEAQKDQRSARANDVAREHAQQLVSYLRKTRLVPGPAPDLLYLESAGTGHGIDTVLGDRLQRAAVDNEVDEVLRLVANAADDGQGRGALLVLADVVRQAQPGVEGRNVVSALLQGIDRSGVELGDAADTIADAVAGHLAQAELGNDDLLGALSLARASSRDVGPLLVNAVLNHPSASSRSDVAVALLDGAADIPDDYRAELADAAKTALLEDPAEAATRLLALPLHAAQRLLGEATKPLKQASDAHYAGLRAHAEGDAAPAVSPSDLTILETPPHEALAAVYDTVVANERDLDDQNGVQNARALSVELLRLMLALNHVEHRHVVVDRLDHLAPIDDPDLIGKVLTATARRRVEGWARWLDPLDSAALGYDASLAEQVDSLAATLWKKLVDDEPPADDDAEVAINALARCASEVAADAKLQSAVRETLEAPFMTQALVDSQDPALRHARRFADAQLLDRAALADIVLSAAAEMLAEATVVTATYQRTATTILAAEQPAVVAALLARVRQEAPHGTDAVVQRVMESAANATWLSDAERANVQLTAAAALRARDSDFSSPVSLDELRPLAAELGDEDTVDETFALWLGQFAETPADAWGLVEPLVDAELPPETRAALSSFSQQLDSGSRLLLIEPALQRSIERPVHRSFFETAHLSEAPAHKVAERLRQLFSQTDDQAGSRAVLDLWQQLSPTGDVTQRRLVEDIYLPLISNGDAGLDLALSFFGLVANIKGIRKPVTAAFEAAARTDDQKRRVDERLLSANWKRKSLFGFGPAVDRDK